MKKIYMVILALVCATMLLSACGENLSGDAKKAAGGKGRCTSNGFECGDCVDNDGDGLTDYAVNPKGKVTGDPDCDSLTDDSEAPISCGDGSCNGDETCSTCPSDCGACPPVCGDNQCDSGETCSSCVQDCGICDSCIDSDGWNTFVQGTVNGTVDGTPYNYIDWCNSTTILSEYGCEGDQMLRWDFDCSLNITTRCENGACV